MAQDGVVAAATPVLSNTADIATAMTLRLRATARPIGEPRDPCLAGPRRDADDRLEPICLHHDSAICHSVRLVVTPNYVLLSSRATNHEQPIVIVSARLDGS